ncbi:hypothetical protein ACKI1I_38495 [Streptomyces turgidiscabies]|nr:MULTISPECIES: hypothetical protein [Streptomyces]MDX3496013.1 hypothetical protein [Streptomyces turgidiscabies]
MFLVHLTLDPCAGNAPLPGDIAGLLRSGATAEDGLEHVAVHASARPYPVLGLFLLSPDLAVAEAAAERLWRRAAARHPGLGAWRLRRAEAPLMHPEIMWPEGGVNPGRGQGAGA